MNSASPQSDHLSPALTTPEISGDDDGRGGSDNARSGGSNIRPVRNENGFHGGSHAGGHSHSGWYRDSDNVPDALFPSDSTHDGRAIPGKNRTDFPYRRELSLPERFQLSTMSGPRLPEMPMHTFSCQFLLFWVVRPRDSVSPFLRRNNIAFRGPIDIQFR